MNIKIGAKIKALRKRDDITQERLADVLGVTSQAISRWESENGYPDIEYITPIANFFNVSIDYLFDHDTAEKRRKIDAYCAQYEKNQVQHMKLHQIQEQIDLMRQALAEFPAEEKLLLNLAISLYFKWGSYGFYGDKESGQYDFEKHKSYDSWEEAVKIMEELLASSTDDAIRSECRRFLAPIYGGIGEKEKLLAIAEKCDNIMSCKQAILSDGLWGEDGIKAKQEYLAALSMSLLHELFRTGHYSDLDMETKKESYDIIVNLFKFVFRGDYGGYHLPLSSMHQYYADFVQKEKPDEAVEALSKAFVHAKAEDELYLYNEEGEITYTSPLVNRLKYRRKNRNPSNATQELLEQMKGNRHMELHENTEFVALVKEMEAWLVKMG